jgi:translation initiation factor IF-2
MVNDLGQRIKTAGPSTPVEITGINDVPQAGDRFVIFTTEPCTSPLIMTLRSFISPCFICSNKLSNETFLLS